MTTAGEVFLTEAQVILLRTEQAIYAVRQSAIQASGRLGVGFTEMARGRIIHS